MTPVRWGSETSQQLGTETGPVDGEKLYVGAATLTAESKLSPPLDADATTVAVETKMFSSLDTDVTADFERKLSSLLMEDTNDAGDGKSSSASAVTTTVAKLSQLPSTANEERTKRTQASPPAPRGTVTETWRLLSSHRLPASCETNFSHSLYTYISYNYKN